MLMPGTSRKNIKHQRQPTRESQVNVLFLFGEGTGPTRLYPTSKIPRFLQPKPFDRNHSVVSLAHPLAHPGVTRHAEVPLRCVAQYAGQLFAVEGVGEF